MAVFVPYLIFEVPSNILLKKFKRPSHYLGILTTAWGIVMTCTGLVRNFESLFALRILLGIFEYVSMAFAFQRRRFNPLNVTNKRVLYE